MLLAPSEIHFLHDDSAGSCIVSPDVVDELGQRLEENRERVPKIQVVEKDGSWFALNDSYLRVYRELEKQGRCPRVNVTVVSLSKVPQDLQKGMTVTSPTTAAPAAAVLPTSPVVAAGADDKSCAKEHEQCSNAAPPTTTTPSSTAEAQKVATPGAGRRRPETQAARDASCEAGAPHRRCFLKSRSSGGSGARPGASSRDPPRPAATECADSSSDEDDDDEEVDDEEYDDEYEYDDEDEYEEEEDEESLTCNVCDRSFASGRRLSRHQQRKRHFGCPVCDALFPSLLALEQHRESLDHWSDDEERHLQRPRASTKRQHRGGRACDDDFDDEDLDDEEDESSEEETESDSDGLEPGPKSQELERLL
ncbi:uncharacterized protein LOC144100802 isoform X2 [Amblyomma americanum]